MLKTGRRLIFSQHGSAYPTDTYALILKGIFKYSRVATRAFSLDYRRSSAAPLQARNPFPAALLDAIAGYRYVLSLGFLPQNVIILGDSAGGNLALTLVRYIKETEPAGLSMPGSLILHSPWIDITHSRDEPGSSFRMNTRYDIIHPSSEFCAYGRRAYLGRTWSLNEAKVNPYIACTSAEIEPKKGEYRDYPKTLIIAGDIEWIRDDAIRIADYLKLDNPQPGHITLNLMPNTLHDVLVLGFAEPQRTETLLKVVQWIDDR